jgi:hypothetical protein
MCKSKYVAFLFCLTSTIANAQSFEIDRKLHCDKVDNIVKILKEFGEIPIWQGRNNQGLTNIVTINTTTNTWTIIVTDGDKACVMDDGEGYGLRQNLIDGKTV